MARDWLSWRACAQSCSLARYSSTDRNEMVNSLFSLRTAARSLIADCNREELVILRCSSTELVLEEAFFRFFEPLFTDDDEA